MFEGLSTMELIQILLPFIVIEFALKAMCIYLIVKKGVKNLSKPIWIVIVLLITTIGSVLFLLFGRGEYTHD